MSLDLHSIVCLVHANSSLFQGPDRYQFLDFSESTLSYHDLSTYCKAAYSEVITQQDRTVHCRMLTNCSLEVKARN